MRKIIISDYDNTLYTNDQDMLVNIDMIHKFRKKGNLFVVATGRSYFDFNQKLKEFSIPFDYLILSHGAIILDKNKNVIELFPIDKRIMYGILERIKRIKGIKRTILFDVYESDVSIDCDILTKLILEVDHPKTGKEVSDFIKWNFKEVKSYVIFTEKSTLVEVISSNTDKGEAIERLLNLEDMNHNEVYTIGDGSNDVEMIEKYNGYGMTHSEQCVLDITNKRYDNVYNLIEEIL